MPDAGEYNKTAVAFAVSTALRRIAKFLEAIKIQR